MGQSFMSPSPSVAQQTATERRVALSAGCQLRRSVIDRVHWNYREAFDSLQKSHSSLPTLHFLICFLCNIIFCQILQTPNCRNIFARKFNYKKDTALT